MLNSVIVMTEKKILSEILEKIYYASSCSIILCIIVTTGIYMGIGILIEAYFNKKKKFIANYVQTECQFRYCGTAIPFLTVRSTAR